MPLLRVGFQTAVAGLFSTLYALMPFAVLLMLPHIWAGWSGPHPAPFTPAYMHLIFRLNLTWLALACGLGVALAAYIAPAGQPRRYAQASLLVQSVFYVVVLLEMLAWPRLLAAMALHTTAHSFLLPARDMVVAVAGYLLAAFAGWRLGMAARNRPGAPMTRLLEWCRTMRVGNSFGKPIRLKL